MSLRVQWLASHTISKEKVDHVIDVNRSMSDRHAEIIIGMHRRNRDQLSRVMWQKFSLFLQVFTHMSL